MIQLLHRMWNENNGQDIAEYAVMMAVILVIVLGTIRLIGSEANNTFSAVARQYQPGMKGAPLLSAQPWL